MNAQGPCRRVALLRIRASTSLEGLRGQEHAAIDPQRFDATEQKRRKTSE